MPAQRWTSNGSAAFQEAMSHRPWFRTITRDHTPDQARITVRLLVTFAFYPWAVDARFIRRTACAAACELLAIPNSLRQKQANCICSQSELISDCLADYFITVFISHISADKSAKLSAS